MPTLHGRQYGGLSRVARTAGRRMTSCNGCGRCCDPVPLPYTQDDVRRALPGEISGGKADRDFILNVLRPLRRRDGLARSWYNGGKTLLTSTDPRDRNVQLVTTFFYECPFFDQATRQCTNYDSRPPMCAGYPWYTARPDPQIALPPECSYNADVGRPVQVRIS